MLDNLPYIPPWRIIVFLLALSGFFIGDAFLLLVNSYDTDHRNDYIRSTIQQILYLEEPVLGTSRKDIEALYGSGEESIPGAVKEGHPVEMIYSMAWGKQLRVIYSAQNIVTQAGIFYRGNDGIYVSLLPNSTADNDYYAATSMVRANVLSFVLKPIVLSILFSLIGAYIVFSVPKLQRWINRNKKPMLPIGVPVDDPTKEKEEIFEEVIPPGQRNRPL